MLTFILLESLNAQLRLSIKVRIKSDDNTATAFSFSRKLPLSYFNNLIGSRTRCLNKLTPPKNLDTLLNMNYGRWGKSFIEVIDVYDCVGSGAYDMT